MSKKYSHCALWKEGHQKCKNKVHGAATKARREGMPLFIVEMKPYHRESTNATPVWLTMVRWFLYKRTIRWYSSCFSAYIELCEVAFSLREKTSLDSFAQNYIAWKHRWFSRAITYPGASLYSKYSRFRNRIYQADSRLERSSAMVIIKADKIYKIFNILVGLLTRLSAVETIPNDCWWLCDNWEERSGLKFETD